MVDQKTFLSAFNKQRKVVNPYLNPHSDTPPLDIERVSKRLKPRWINVSAVKIREDIHKLANIRTQAFSVYSLSYDLSLIEDAVHTIVTSSNEMLLLMKNLGRKPIATGGVEDGIAPPYCDESWVKIQRDTYRLYESPQQLYRATNPISAERTVNYLEE